MVGALVLNVIWLRFCSNRFQFSLFQTLHQSIFMFIHNLGNLCTNESLFLSLFCQNLGKRILIGLLSSIRKTNFYFLLFFFELEEFSFFYLLSRRTIIRNCSFTIPITFDRRFSLFCSSGLSSYILLTHDSLVVIESFDDSRSAHESEHFLLEESFPVVEVGVHFLDPFLHRDPITM